MNSTHPYPWLSSAFARLFFAASLLFAAAGIVHAEQYTWSATASGFTGPLGVAMDAGGNLYVTDYTGNTVNKLTQSGTTWTVTTIAGASGVSGTADGSGTTARFNNPAGIIVDTSGNLFVTDVTNNTIREITLSGTTWTVSTIAGTPGQSGSSDGPGTAARFHSPSGLVQDASGNIYVADKANDTIRELSLSGSVWNVVTIAGSPGVSGSANGSGTAALFATPQGITLDQFGNLYVTDTVGHSIRMLAPAGGAAWTVSTIVGGQAGSADGSGTAAQFQNPTALGIDAASNLFAADTSGETIRKIYLTGTTWNVVTIGGSAGVTGTAGGVGSAARFYNPHGMVCDPYGNIYLADLQNHRICKGAPSLAITGSLAVTGTVSYAFAYQMHTTGTAASYSAAWLPGGLSINAATGLISGTPGVGGYFQINIAAVNSSGTATGILGLNLVMPPSSNGGDSGGTLSLGGTGSFGGTVGTSTGITIIGVTGTTSLIFSSTSTYTGPTIISGSTLSGGSIITGSYASSGTVLTGTGLISGSLTMSGTPATMINPGTPGVSLTGSMPQTSFTGTVGLPFSYTMPVIFSNHVSFNATNLPTGLSVDASTGIVSGTPAASGSFSSNFIDASASGSILYQVNFTIAASPYSTWKTTAFASLNGAAGISGDTDTPAGDGVPNLIKYALGLGPMTNGSQYLPVTGTTTISGTNYLTLTYTQVIAATDIVYTVEVSNDLLTWNSGTGYTAVLSTTPNGDGTNTVVVQDLAPAGSTPHQYMRLKVTKP